MDVPRRLAVRLKGEVAVKWAESVGVYNLSPNLVNGKSNWLQESGSCALWYDKDNEKWKIGLISGIGGYTCRMTTNSNQDQDLPHRVVPWNYMKNYEWIGSKDIIVEEDTSNTLGLF